MKTMTATATFILAYIQLTIGAPLDDDRTTKHWEIQPRENITKHWEIQPRGLDNVMVSMVPYDAEEAEESSANKGIQLTEAPLVGGAGSMPPGAQNDMGTNAQGIISMVPFLKDEVLGNDMHPADDSLEEGDNGTMPPGAVNDGVSHEVSMVPLAIIMVPFDVTEVTEGPWVDQGKLPPGAQNEESGLIMSGAMFLLRAFGL